MALSGSFTGSIHSGHIRLKCDWSATQSVSGNYSTITVVPYLQTDSGYTIKASAVKSGTTTINGTATNWSYSGGLNGSGLNVKLGSVTSGAVAHNADGTKSVTITVVFGIDITFAGTKYNSITASTTVTLNTIPRATTPTVSASSVNMGSSVRIYTSRASSAFTHTLTYSFASATSGTIASGVGTYFDWTTPDLAAFIPNATSGTCTITCKTYNGSTLIGTKTVLVSLVVPSSVVPTVSSVTLAEATSGLSARFGVYVQGKSTVKGTVAASGAKGSTIKAYSITFNGQTYTAATFTSAVLASAGSYTCTAKVQDSRGRWSAARTATITVLAYSAPAVTRFQAYRVDETGAVDDNGSYLALSYAYRVTELNGKNLADVVLEYKKSTDSDWSLLGLGSTLSADSVYKPDFLTFSPDYQYDVRISIADWFGPAPSVLAVLRSGAVILDIGADGKSIGFGRTADRLGVTFGWDVKGRVLGLGAATAQIPEGANLNEYMTLGVYNVTTNAIAAGLKNCPSKSAGTLRVFNGIGKEFDASYIPSNAYVYLYQEYRSFQASDPLYSRTLTLNAATGTWSYGAWYKSATPVAVS